MSSRGLSGGINQPLSPEGIDTIHDTSLVILEKIGVTFESGLQETGEMIADASAAVDREYN